MLSFPRRFPFAITLLFIVAVGCATKRIAQNPTTGRVQVLDAFNQYSPEQEVQVGKQAAAEAMKQLPLLQEGDPTTQYVKRLGERLVAKAPGYKYPYEFHVVNQKEINAFALPGGPVFVNLGTIQAADSEGELAGVMAHEISHIVLRHATSNASKEQMAQIPLAILGAVLGNGTGGQLARLGVSLGANGLFLKYSRDAEREADEMGAQIMYDAGYDPYDLVEFFSKLEKQGGNGGPQFLSDHPNPGNREKDVTAVISKFPKKQYAREDSPEFEQIKERVAQMKPMTAQQVAQYQREQQVRMQRAAEAEIRPSGSFKMANGGFFQMEYPANWEVLGQSNSGVTIAPRAGVSENAIAYGVVIGGIPAQGGSLDAVTRSLVQNLQQQNPNLQVQGARQISVNGAPAMSVGMLSPSPLTDSSGQPVAEQDTLVTVQRQDGAVIYAVFVAPQQDMPALNDTYTRMLQSLRVE
ncbi:MAG TPA: M48 family metalloprotease [Terriglobales bacterium]|nr:M48 family metalloprotease [Terriglobales bacterium]